MCAWLIGVAMVLGGVLLFTFTERLMRFQERRSPDWYRWLYWWPMLYDHKTRRIRWIGGREFNVVVFKFCGICFALFGVLWLVLTGTGEVK